MPAPWRLHRPGRPTIRPLLPVQTLHALADRHLRVARHVLKGLLLIIQPRLENMLHRPPRRRRLLRILHRLQRRLRRSRRLRDQWNQQEVFFRIDPPRRRCRCQNRWWPIQPIMYQFRFILISYIANLFNIFQSSFRPRTFVGLRIDPRSTQLITTAMTLLRLNPAIPEPQPLRPSPTPSPASSPRSSPTPPSSPASSDGPP